MRVQHTALGRIIYHCPMWCATVHSTGARQHAGTGFLLLQGYAWHFGALWAASSDQVLPRMMEMVGDTWATYSTPLKWLMNARNVAVCTPEQQRECLAQALLLCEDGCV